MLFIGRRVKTLEGKEKEREVRKMAYSLHREKG